MLEKADKVGVLATEDEDIRSLRELVMYGLKGLAAYAEQRREPGITFSRAGGGHGAAGNQGREQAEAELRDRRGVDASLAGANQWREVSASAAEARVNGLVADTGQRGEPPGPGVGFTGALEQARS